MWAKAERLERALLALPQVDCPVRHVFAEGLYARELTIPAGVTCTGKVHLTEHISILSKGSITVWTDEGMATLEAPAIVTSKPGLKRVGHAHTETVWTTVHATDLKDPDEIIKQICVETMDEYFALVSPERLQEIAACPS